MPDPKAIQAADNGLMMLVQHHLQPAGNGEVLRRTTAELHQIIETLAPGTYHPSELYQVLYELGYRTQLVGDTIYWLISAR
jgi:hypothetical protein